MARTKASCLGRDRENPAGKPVRAMTEPPALGWGISGIGGLVAVYGSGCLLACAVMAVSGVVAPWLAALVIAAVVLAAVPAWKRRRG